MVTKLCLILKISIILMVAGTATAAYAFHGIGAMALFLGWAAISLLIATVIMNTIGFIAQ